MILQRYWFKKKKNLDKLKNKQPYRQDYSRKKKKFLIRIWSFNVYNGPARFSVLAAIFKT